MGWKMGLMDYGPGANAAVQAYLAAKNNKQKMAIEERRMALEEQRLQALMNAQRVTQARQGLLDQRADTTWQQQQEDRRAAQEKEASRSFDFANLGVSKNLPGLMSMGAIDQTSSDPRMLAQAARGQLPGMEQPSAIDYAQIAARHGNVEPLVNLETRGQKENPLIASLRQAAANGTISDQGLAILNKIDGGESPLYQRKPDTTETWGEPYETTVGGKKIRVQKSNRGQERAVGQDVSTTVKVDTGNRFKDAVTLRKEFNNLPEIKEYNTMQSKFSAMEKAMQEAKSSNNLVAVDQALISLYNKLTDPSSVVRESEYARTAENIPLLNQIKGKADKVMRGGAGLTNAEREALMRMARLMKQGYEEIRQRRVMEYHSYATDYGIDPKTVIRDVMKESESGNSKPKRMTYNPATGGIE